MLYKVRIARSLLQLTFIVHNFINKASQLWLDSSLNQKWLIAEAAAHSLFEDI